MQLLIVGAERNGTEEATLVLRGEGLVNRWRLKGGKVSVVMPEADILEDLPR